MMVGRLRECLRTLHWSIDDLADELGRPVVEVRAWFEGREHVSLAVAAWLEALVRLHRSLPVPDIGETVKSVSSGEATTRPPLKATSSTIVQISPKARGPRSEQGVLARMAAARQLSRKGSTHAASIL